MLLQLYRLHVDQPLKWSPCDTSRYDTSLTDAGVQQAKAAAKQTRHLRPAPELIIASPLSRALHTADLCLPPATYPDAPRIAHPLARERLYLSSDVGLPKCVRCCLKLARELLMRMSVQGWRMDTTCSEGVSDGILRLLFVCPSARLACHCQHGLP